MSDLLKAKLSKKSSTSITWNSWSTHVIPGMNPSANIKVVWVWWWWCNAVNRMINIWIDWVQFISLNTDAQALSQSHAEKKIAIWKALTKWLWAWSNPTVWKSAAEESSEEIKNMLEWADMIFITCWLWWWTWTWAAPVVAELARELWILTVWVVTKPFSFEWQRRLKQAQEWYVSLKDNVDTLITIPNDKILSIIDKKTPLTDAFMVVDDVLRQGISWVTELIIWSGLINVDFADVRAIMKDAGSAMMGIWYGTWENRSMEAARAAIDSPLLELSINWAKWVLINITWWSDLSMFEVDEAAKVITEVVDPESNIIFWAVIDERYTWEIKVTVIATWFSEESQSQIIPWISSKMKSLWLWWVQKSMSQWNSNRPSQEDLDIPAFMRKVIK